MYKYILTIVLLSLLGCSTPMSRRETFDLIQTELSKSAQKIPTTPIMQPSSVSDALLPALKIDVPKVKQPIEERFNLSLNNLPAHQFFMTIASGTRYSMLIHPDVAGNISANFKDVTFFEALDAIRELYGYDYKAEGTRIYIKPLTMQTRVFQVNYLTGVRRGSSDTRVTSGSVSDQLSGSSSSGGAAAGGTTTSGGSSSQTLNSSKISTTSTSDFWQELKASLEAIVGLPKDGKDGKDGRSVVISPQSGVVVVRAMWDEIRSVDAYLKATQLSVDRQVVIEAKILEVQLNDTYQTGINWASFASVKANSNNRASLGFVSPGTLLKPLPYAGGTPDTMGTNGTAAIVATTGFGLGTASSAAGSVFGLAFQTSNFAALLSFLETQGNVHVLSSPRIATLNNQKAVLKVGTDEFFVTNVSTTTTTGGTGSTSSPTVTLQPFFSGVALDVTPQIDEAGNIILHIHPSVSNVTTVDKPINLGTGGSYSLPLASSAVSETDSVVRGKDGQIVAIGGLMRQSTVADRSQIPGAGNLPVVGSLFRNTNQTTQKRELVILLKPTIVQSNANSIDDMLETQKRIQYLEPSQTSEQK